MPCTQSDHDHHKFLRKLVSVIVEIHRLLKRQIRNAKLSIDPLDGEWSNLMELVNNSYQNFDEERRLNQRAVDISNEELKEINHELERQNDFLKSFNYGLAHDARNHTANLKGLIKMFHKYKNSGDKEMIDAISQKLELSVNQMSSIIDGFLFLSSVENADEGIKKEIDPDELEEMIRLEIDYLLQRKELDLQFDFDFEHLHYSPHILRVVLVNLISNSLKFSRKDVNTEIRASIQLKPQSIFIKVVDNGIGMDLEDSESKVFKLFDNRNKKSKEKGFGIGLFMIKRILDKNHGEIEIDSKLKKGTTVSIHLPFNRKEK